MITSGTKLDPDDRTCENDDAMAIGYEVAAGRVAIDQSFTSNADK